ncbi:nitrilotriacetate monooxygenase, partial [Xanthobacter autotrophicus]
LEERFVREGADGFNIMAPHLPGGLEDFIDDVVPILRKRGLFRSEYEGTTLRENLGLPFPRQPAERSGVSSVAAE